MKKNLLLIGHAEICHQPRLIKAADYLETKGWTVTVFNPVTGMADQKTYEDFKKSRNWMYIENDISKRTLKSKLNWLVISLVHKAIKLFHSFGLNFGTNFFVNKGLIFASIPGKYDLIITNLIDNLPFAVKQKKIHSCKLIYDSQEFFLGQFPQANFPSFHKWIAWNERKYIHQADLITTTTNILKEKLIEVYNLSSEKVLRVRNAPPLKSFSTRPDLVNTSPLKCIWHGFRISLGSDRGINLILEAISFCQFPVELHLQGKIDDREREYIDAFVQRRKLQNNIFIKPPAEPDNIVESLIGYDIGILGELPTNENMFLTSSNKLFESIAAGLMVIGPNLPGLAETILVEKIGLTYRPGDWKDLHEKLNFVNENREILSEFKSNSNKAYTARLNWGNDYNQVVEILNL